jgi:hypothetical protein
MMEQCASIPPSCAPTQLLDNQFLKDFLLDNHFLEDFLIFFILRYPGSLVTGLPQTVCRLLTFYLHCI